MKKYLVALLIALASPAAAQTIDQLGAGAAVAGTNFIPAFQGANPAKRITATQIAAFVLGGNTIPTASDTIALLAVAQTLSNKTFVAPALGTPASAVLTNATGTAAGLTAGHVTTNANSTGDVTSVGNATTLAASGVTAGAYTNANITVDAKGRVTVAANGTAGGNTATIASGATAMGVAAIASAACATAVTATAAGVATTDTVTASFNGDPTAVNGYIPSTSGMLTVFVYPTSGNVNFKVCNNTGASVTPGALTLNWRVVR